MDHEKQKADLHAYVESMRGKRLYVANYGPDAWVAEEPFTVGRAHCGCCSHGEIYNATKPKRLQYVGRPIGADRSLLFRCFDRELPNKKYRTFAAVPFVNEIPHPTIPT